MNCTFTRLIYRLLIVVVSPLVWLHIAGKAVRFREFRYALQRVGLGYGSLPGDCVWLHCASVGEVNAALPLIHTLHERTPHACFVITTNTPTGAQIVERLDLPYVAHAYLPFDWPLAVSRLIRHIRPVALYVLETELWPNVFFECRRLDVPVSILNGRLSLRTTGTRGFVRSLLRCTLRIAEGIYARTQKDADAYIEMGADPAKVRTIGNIKYAPPRVLPTAPAYRHTRFDHVARDVVVAASTHEDEELQIARRWLQLGRGELLVIAPRHPERGDAVRKQLRPITPEIAVRSRDDAITPRTAIYLLDTVGELNTWFGIAKLVVMGGSFAPVGGHNLLEPAHAGKVVLFGPHMENFVDETEQALAAGAAVEVADMDALFEQLTALLDDDRERERLEANATRFSRQYRDIVEEYADIVAARLG